MKEKGNQHRGVYCVLSSALSIFTNIVTLLSILGAQLSMSVHGGWIPGLPSVTKVNRCSSLLRKM